MTGRVLRIDPVVDPATGTVNVRVAVDGTPDLGDGLRLRPGMFVNVRITTDVHENVPAIPKRAVLYEGETPYVYVLRNPRQDTVEGSGEGSGTQTVTTWGVERMVLTTGYDDPLLVEILSGVVDGDQVVVAGQNGLDLSARVTVSEATTALPGNDSGRPAEADAQPASGTPSAEGSSAPANGSGVTP